MVPDALQIGKSNENSCVFIDFQRIQVGPGGARILSEEGQVVVKAFVAGGRKLATYNLAD